VTVRVATSRTARDDVPVVIVGAGHSGLAMSAMLAERGVEHVLFERGEVANAWRTERWDSLRLLTPNWQNTLPGYRYDGADPDGYMTVPEVVDFIAAYAERIAAPVRTRTSVKSVKPEDAGFRVTTAAESIRCSAVVLANGACAIPSVPAFGSSLPASIVQVTPREYRNPGMLPDGGVLVVGASATGLQLADEIHRSGRSVTLAVGEHVRMPRVYRGADVYRWLDVLGLLDQRFDEVDDLVRARRVPSPQLIGTPERATLDLNALTANGVVLVGRLATIRDGKALFSGGLRNNCAMADLKLGRLLDAIDGWIAAHGRDNEFDEPVRFERTRVDAAPALSLDLTGGSIRSVVWATGYRPDYHWLDVPAAFDQKGRLQHDGGVVAAPGLYALGLTFLRRRKSSFIHGATDDARDLADHLCGRLGASRRKSGR